MADYWGKSEGEAKAIIARKILWGPADVAILEQFLVDARVKALESAKPPQTQAPTNYFESQNFVNMRMWKHWRNFGATHRTVGMEIRICAGVSRSTTNSRRFSQGLVVSRCRSCVTYLNPEKTLHNSLKTA